MPLEPKLEIRPARLSLQKAQIIVANDFKTKRLYSRDKYPLLGGINIGGNTPKVQAPHIQIPTHPFPSLPEDESSRARREKWQQLNLSTDLALRRTIPNAPDIFRKKRSLTESMANTVIESCNSMANTVIANTTLRENFGNSYNCIVQSVPQSGTQSGTNTAYNGSTPISCNSANRENLYPSFNITGDRRFRKNAMDEDGELDVTILNINLPDDGKNQTGFGNQTTGQHRKLTPTVNNPDGSRSSRRSSICFSRRDTITREAAAAFDGFLAKNKNAENSANSGNANEEIKDDEIKNENMDSFKNIDYVMDQMENLVVTEKKNGEKRISRMSSITRHYSVDMELEPIQIPISPAEMKDSQSVEIHHRLTQPSLKPKSGPFSEQLRTRNIRLPGSVGIVNNGRINLPARHTVNCSRGGLHNVALDAKIGGKPMLGHVPKIQGSWLPSGRNGKESTSISNISPFCAHSGCRVSDLIQKFEKPMKENATGTQPVVKVGTQPTQDSKELVVGEEAPLVHNQPESLLVLDGDIDHAAANIAHVHTVISDIAHNDTVTSNIAHGITGHITHVTDEQGITEDFRNTETVEEEAVLAPVEKTIPIGAKRESGGAPQDLPPARTLPADEQPHPTPKQGGHHWFFGAPKKTPRGLFGAPQRTQRGVFGAPQHTQRGVFGAGKSVIAQQKRLFTSRAESTNQGVTPRVDSVKKLSMNKKKISTSKLSSTKLSSANDSTTVELESRSLEADSVEMENAGEEVAGLDDQHTEETKLADGKMGSANPADAKLVEGHDAKIAKGLVVEELQGQQTIWTPGEQILGEEIVFSKRGTPNIIVAKQPVSKTGKQSLPPRGIQSLFQPKKSVARQNTMELYDASGKAALEARNATAAQRFGSLPRELLCRVPRVPQQFRPNGCPPVLVANAIRTSSIGTPLVTPNGTPMFRTSLNAGFPKFNVPLSKNTCLKPMFNCVTPRLSGATSIQPSPSNRIASSGSASASGSATCRSLNAEGNFPFKPQARPSVPVTADGVGLPKSK